MQKAQDNAEELDRGSYQTFSIEDSEDKDII